jgi:hypothetical protein
MTLAFTASVGVRARPSGGGGTVAPDLTNGQTVSIAENAALNSIVLDVAYTGDAPTSVSITSGNTGTAFSIAMVGSAIRIKVAATLDYETTASYTLGISASNGAGSDTTSVTITVTDVTEGGGAGSTLETITFDNWSGGSRTNPTISFRRFFEKGDVATGEYVDLKYSSTSLTTQQADDLAYHDDGSLKAATFSAVVPAGSVSDNGTFNVALVVGTGSFNTSTSLALSDLSGHDFKLRVKIGSTNYYTLVNNLITAGTYRQIRVGGACRAWHLWGPMRAGTGGSSTDHGQLQAHVYAYVWHDGRVTTFCKFINGRMSSGAVKITAAEIEWLDGATSIQSFTGTLDLYPRHAYFIVQSDGLPYWSSNQEFHHARIKPIYFYDKKISHYVHSTAAARGAIDAATLRPYEFSGDLSAGWTSWPFNASGGSPAIGHMPWFAAEALTLSSATSEKTNAERKAYVQEARQQALACGVKWCAHVLDVTTGQPPVIVPQDYTARGMPASQTYMGFGGSASPDISDSGEWYPGGDNGGNDWSHQPEWTFFEYATTGWEWWGDLSVEMVAGYVVSMAADIGFVNGRAPYIDGTQYYVGWMQRAGQTRGCAWALRNMSNIAFGLGDSHPAQPYMDQLVQNGRGILNALCTTGGQFQTGATAIGMVPYNYREEQYDGGSVVDSVAVFAPWQMTKLVTQIAMAVQREQMALTDTAVTVHMQKGAMEWMKACPYWAMPSYSAAWYVEKAGPPHESFPPGYTQPFPTSWAAEGNLTFVRPPGDPPRRLISNSGGSSGTCPTSGTIAGTYGYAVGYAYPQLWHAAIEVAALAGIPQASDLLTYFRNTEAGASITETGSGTLAWANAPWNYRLRDPATYSDGL